MIELRTCRIEPTAFGVRTVFPDGSNSSNWPWPDDALYVAVARACGFEDLRAYCREHDLTHNWLSERMFDAPSYVTSYAARGLPLDRTASMAEEWMCWLWQRYAAGLIEPPDGRWPGWLEEFKALAARLAT